MIYITFNVYRLLFSITIAEFTRLNKYQSVLLNIWSFDNTNKSIINIFIDLFLLVLSVFIILKIICYILPGYGIALFLNEH